MSPAETLRGVAVLASPAFLWSSAFPGLWLLALVSASVFTCVVRLKAEDGRSQGNPKETEGAHRFHPESTRVSSETSIKGGRGPRESEVGLKLCTSSRLASDVAAHPQTTEGVAPARAGRRRRQGGKAVNRIGYTWLGAGPSHLCRTRGTVCLFFSASLQNSSRVLLSFRLFTRTSFYVSSL